MNMRKQTIKISYSPLWKPFSVKTTVDCSVDVITMQVGPDINLQ